MITAKYFSESEFRRCSPACSLQDMRQSTMNRFDSARRIAGIPFVINSAYRTPEYELSKGRTGDGAHTHRCALDIRCNSSTNRLRIVYGLIMAGFTRIGIGETFIHADDDETKPQNVMWHYYE